MLSSFYPVVAGRTSDALSRYRSLYQVQVSKLGIQQLEDQLSSGKRFSLPSQDPTAAVRVIGLQRELEFRDQTLRNLDSSQGYLNVTESTLGNVQDTLIEIRGLGVESAGNVSSDEERAGLVAAYRLEPGRIHRFRGILQYGAFRLQRDGFSQHTTDQFFLARNDDIKINFFAVHFPLFGAPANLMPRDDCWNTVSR